MTERSSASALEIARQLIQGRPGFDDADRDPVVVMGGGEDLFFPEGTPAQAAVEEGCALVRTRAEFEALAGAIEAGDADPADLRVLALFASQDVVVAVSEEELIAAGLGPTR